MNQKLIIIAAASENRVIGNKGDIPWYIKEDFQHFKKATMGSSMIMGRKTFQSLPGVLSERNHLILSSSPGIDTNSVFYYNSIDQLLEDNADEDKIFICGGSKVYEQFMDTAHEMILTRIKTNIEGDTFFPVISTNWKVDRVEPLINSSSHEAEIIYLKNIKQS